MTIKKELKELLEQLELTDDMELPQCYDVAGVNIPVEQEWKPLSHLEEEDK